MLKAIVVSALFLSIPLFSDAETKATKELCDAKPDIKISRPSFEPGVTSDALTKSIGNTNFCTNSSITLTPLYSIREETHCICVRSDSEEANKAKLENVGCGPDQAQPEVTISIDPKISGCVNRVVTISKCAKDPRAAYEAECKSGTAMPGDSDATNAVTIDRTPWDASMLPTFSVPDGSDAIEKALTNAEVSAGDAERLAKEQPQNAQEYIRALASNNLEAIKASAAKLQISPNLAANGGAITADSPPSSTDPPGRVAEGDKAPGAAGFRPPLTDQSTWTGEFPQQCGIEGDAGRLMRSESGCGRVTVNPLERSVRGPYQFMCGTWNTYARNTGNAQYSCACDSSGYYAGQCTFVDDPYIGARIVNAQYELYRAQYGNLCTSVNQHWSTCVYGIHFAGEAGFQRLVQAYRANPYQPLDQATVAGIFGSRDAYTKNLSVFQQAGTVGGLFEFLEGKMRNDGRTTSTLYIPTGVSTNTGYSLNPGYASFFSPQSSFPPSQTPVLMSPFAQAALFASQPIAQQNVPVQQPVQQKPISHPPAQVSIIADPRLGKAGDEFTFTWKSSGVSPSSCTLALAGSTTVPVAASGTQKVRIRIAQIYSLVFTCRGLDGAPAVVRETVFVQ